LGAKAGVVFNPSTPPEVIAHIMDQIDLVLVMSVNPGFGGQKFLGNQLKKIERLRAMIDATGRDIVLEVDGGVTAETAPKCIAAGATALVAGTAVFRGGRENYAANIRALRGEIALT
jgi:ribulose-phosphate 3-epimerase